MQEQSLRSLEQLAEQDPVSRPLARLQLKALGAAADPVWETCSSIIIAKSSGPHVPVLHRQTLPVNRDAASVLIASLMDVLRQDEILDEEPERPGVPGLDPLALLEAAIEGDEIILERFALEAGVNFPVLATIGQCASLPVMLAAGRKVMQENRPRSWKPGYCPVCGNWPLLAEQRGLDRQQWLRCGRCSAAWRSRHQRCVFCDNTDHTKLGYLAAEQERESRRATTCTVCHGYLKIIATVSPLAIGDLLRQDLASVELDIAATDEGYTRPVRPGFALDVAVVPDDQANGGLPQWN